MDKQDYWCCNQVGMDNEYIGRWVLCDYDGEPEIKELSNKVLLNQGLHKFDLDIFQFQNMDNVKL